MEQEKVGLDRTIGLFSAIGIVIGSIIGSGIFISPIVVLEHTGSIGLCLIIWALCGVVSLFGAICYIELGTLIPESGSEMVYVLRGYESLNRHVGNILAFLFSWSSNMVMKPSSVAAISLACSTYTLKQFPSPCGSFPFLDKIGALLIIALVTYINLTSVVLTNKMLVCLTFSKVVALIIVVLMGIVNLFRGYTMNFDNLFEGTIDNPLMLVGGFYGGLWAFDGWNSINYLTEEIINPKRNLTLSLLISIPLITVIYVFVNISYFTVMTKADMLASPAVAITWAEIVLGKYLMYILTITIILSTFSSALANFYSGSRLNYVAARFGYQLKLLAMVHPEKKTPDPSLVFAGILSALYLIFVPNLDGLIDVFSFATWIFYGLSCSALIIMRYTRKEAKRIFVTPLPIPIFMVLLSSYLVVSPLVQNASAEHLIVLLILAAGMVVYYFFIHKKQSFKIMDKITVNLQIFFEVVLPHSEYEAE